MCLLFINTVIIWQCKGISNLKTAIASQATTIYLVVLTVYLHNNYKNAQKDV